MIGDYLMLRSLLVFVIAQKDLKVLEIFLRNQERKRVFKNIVKGKIIKGQRLILIFSQIQLMIPIGHLHQVKTILVVTKHGM